MTQAKSRSILTQVWFEDSFLPQVFTCMGKTILHSEDSSENFGLRIGSGQWRRNARGGGGGGGGGKGGQVPPPQKKKWIRNFKEYILKLGKFSEKNGER